MPMSRFQVNRSIPFAVIGCPMLRNHKHVRPADKPTMEHRKPRGKRHDRANEKLLIHPVIRPELERGQFEPCWTSCQQEKRAGHCPRRWAH